MNMIFLGAPGAGKGTQAGIVSEKFSIPTISTGNIIREALKSGTEIGKKLKQFLDEGKLAPDNIVLDIVKERINKPDCENGFILDGFPRTIPQAEALDEMGINIDIVIDIDVNDEEIVSRMSGRRVCEKCGASYNLAFNKPSVDGVCDKCSGTLVQRQDDHPEVVNKRLKVYHSETEPLKDYYKKQEKLVVIDGMREISQITEELMAKLEALK